MIEEWKIISKFPKYEVSSLGRIRKISTNKLLYLKDHTAGYKQVIIQEANKKYYLYVHRLVALAFLEDTDLNPNGTPIVGRKEVDHKDSDRNNNNVDNLRWCDTNYNIKARYNRV